VCDPFWARKITKKSFWAACPIVNVRKEAYNVVDGTSIQLDQSRCMHAAGAQPVVEVDADVPFSEAERSKLEKTATFLAKATKQAEEDAPRTMFLDPSELTEEDLRPVSKTEYFLPKSSARFARGPAGIAPLNTSSRPEALLQFQKPALC
jgi:hypothetical protein